MALQVALVKEIIRRINPNAEVRTCVRGELEAAVDVLGSAKAKGAASYGILDEHRQMVNAVKKQAAEDYTSTTSASAGCTDPSHDHSHDSHADHGHAKAADCSEPTCTDPSHDHTHADHGHAKAAAEAEDCATPVGCTDPTHDHSHDDHDHPTPVGCTDPTHDHSHDDHDHPVRDEDCSKPGCTDPTHDHSHDSHSPLDSHGHSHSTTHTHHHESETDTTAKERFGITSFVYVNTGWDRMATGTD